MGHQFVGGVGGGVLIVWQIQTSMNINFNYIVQWFTDSLKKPVLVGSEADLIHIAPLYCCIIVLIVS